MTEYADGPMPDTEELQQQEPEAVPLRVETVGPTLVQTLPARLGTSRSFTVGTTDPVPLGGRDLRRRRMMIIAETDVYVGNAQDVRAGDAAVLPADLGVLELGHVEEVYVKAVTTEGRVSAITEVWAD